MRYLRCFNLIFAAVLLGAAMTCSADSLISVAFTGGSVTSKTGFAAIGLTTNDFWNTYNVNSGSFSDLSFVDGTASGAGIITTLAGEAGTNGASDPMYGTYVSSYYLGNITVTVSDLAPAKYNFYFYGHGWTAALNGVFQLSVGSQSYGTEATTTGSGWTSSVWQQGVQFVEFSGVSVAAGQTVTITVESSAYGYAALSGLQMSVLGPTPPDPPAILSQPVSQTVGIGTDATFRVVAGGTAPLTYQWVFNHANIPTATNSSFSISDVQPANSGNYSVIVTNAYGSVTSVVATLDAIVIATNTTIIDVAFTASPATGKTGLAAIGATANDFWNTFALTLRNDGYTVSGSLPSVNYVNGNASSAVLMLANVEQAISNGASDPMYGTYFFTQGGNMTLTVTNLVGGAYDIYLYGHGNEDNQNSIFQLSVGSLSYGSEQTTNGSGWLSSVWQEGEQYVVFSSVVVSAGQTITITVEPGVTGYPVLSGMQMSPLVVPDSGAPVVVRQPTNQAVAQTATAIFGVIAGGAAPLAYQWLFNGASISAATNRTYGLTDAQQSNVGDYSVTVSNTYGGVTSAVATLTITPTLIDVAFTVAFSTSKMGFAATGLTTNDFWNTLSFYDTSVADLDFTDGTASGVGLTVEGAITSYENVSECENGSSDPMYGIDLPADGTTLTMTLSNLSPGLYDFYFYGHGSSDSQNSTFQLTVGSQNYGNEEFGSEATTTGSGWLSSVWQEGVQYVEFTNVSVYYAGQMITITAAPLISGMQIASLGAPSSPSNVFIVTQPASQQLIQGSGAIFGIVAIGAAPLAYQWLFNGATISAATNRTYSLTDAQQSNVGDYSVIVSNTYGSVTSLVAALNVITPVTKVIDVAFTSASVTGETGFAATGVATNDFWNTCELNSGKLPNLQFMDGTASGAGLNVVNATAAATNGASDPMYSSYLYCYYGDITVTVINLIPFAYDFYLYGHGNVDSQNSVFQLTVGTQSYGNEATINGSGWLSSIWQEGVQYVEFTNVIVPSGQTITITVEPGAANYAVLSGLQIATAGSTSSNAFIAVQPTNQAVGLGATATFTVAAGGASPLAYQWLFNGATIPAATNSNYSVTGAQPANIGYYSVIVTNAYGSVASLVAALNVIASPVTQVIDVAFTGASVTGETGFAAAGVGTDDFWNTYVANSGSLPNLEFMDGAASGAALTVVNAAGTNINGASDPMYSSYLYPVSGGNITVTLTSLNAGAYSFYLYGHGSENNQNSVFQLTAGSESYGTEATTNGSGWLSSLWQEGVQYVEFTNVSVSAGQTITITVEPGASQYAVLSGLQIASAGSTSSTVFLVTQPLSETVGQYTTVPFSVVADGTPPLSYQWLLNGTNVSSATNSSYIVPYAQPAKAGNYSVIVTNAYGSVTSQVATLTVINARPASVGPFTNGSFEVPVITSGDDRYAALGDTWLTGWIIGGTLDQVFVVTGSFAGLSAAEGRQWVVFDSQNSPPDGALAQSFRTIVGETYVVTYSVAPAIYNGTPFKSLTMAALASDGSLLASNVTAYTYPYREVWSTVRLTFSARSTNTTLVFTDTSAPNFNTSVALDAVSVIPLPANSTPLFINASIRFVNVTHGVNTPATNFIAHMGRAVVLGRQPLLDASLGTNSGLTLTLYGNPGMSYDLLSTTNLSESSLWTTVGRVTLTDLFQVISLPSATQQMQFFKAVQP